VSVAGGSEQGISPDHSSVFAPGIAMEIAPGVPAGGPLGLAGSGGAPNGSGSVGYVLIYLGN
jgi:hypothetical protein